jgi:HSP20 family molecular chaperone IbpA
MFGRRKKQSFFERLTGAVPVDDFDDYEEEYQDEYQERERGHRGEKRRTPVMSDEDDQYEGNDIEPSYGAPAEEEEEQTGQLSVDVVNTPDSILIRAMLAGIKPGDIDIDISRDMVTIRGTREEIHEEENEDYFHQELFWGTFSRNILLPEEIDVDEAEANEKHGLLTLKLPKLDKNRKTKVHVKTR